jgi:hypothetical protein
MSSNGPFQKQSKILVFVVVGRWIRLTLRFSQATAGLPTGQQQILPVNAADTFPPNPLTTQRFDET